MSWRELVLGVALNTILWVGVPLGLMWGLGALADHNRSSGWYETKCQDGRPPIRIWRQSEE